MTKRVVYKYPFTMEAVRQGDFIDIPMGKVVLVARQNSHDELPTIWVEHELTNNSPPHKYMRLCIVGTGHTIVQDFLVHRGSAVCGRFVWHVYEQVLDD